MVQRETRKRLETFNLEPNILLSPIYSYLPLLQDSFGFSNCITQPIDKHHEINLKSSCAAQAGLDLTIFLHLLLKS